MNNQPQQIGVNANADDLKGRFSNAAQVSHQDDHFILDFFVAALPAGQLVSRVIVTPRHMKALEKAISEQLKNYEAQFGKIDASEEKSVGFKTS
jgi:hypothetical protein